MIKCYTVKKEAYVEEGIPLRDGMIHVGERGRARKLVRVPLPEKAIVENGRFVGVEQENPKGAAIVYIQDQSFLDGTWYLSAPWSDEEWERVIEEEQAERWERGSEGKELLERKRVYPPRLITEGRKAEGAAGNCGGGPEYLLIMVDGEAYEMARSGRLHGAPAILKIENRCGEVVLVNPRSEAETRVAAKRWGLLGEALIRALGSEEAVREKFGKEED